MLRSYEDIVTVGSQFGSPAVTYFAGEFYFIYCGPGNFEVRGMKYMILYESCIKLRPVENRISKLVQWSKIFFENGVPTHPQ